MSVCAQESRPLLGCGQVISDECLYTGVLASTATTERKRGTPRNNSEATIPVYVVKNLNEKAIAGMDLINALGICYNKFRISFLKSV